MTRRERLPNRRLSETFDFACGSGTYTATISRFADDRVAEIFISNNKAGSHLDHLARDAAITASIAFQHGAPVDVVRHALQRDHLGRAVTPLGVALDHLAGGNPQ
jgi:ribonucleoside-diphosphate reductase alpha chain